MHTPIVEMYLRQVRNELAHRQSITSSSHPEDVRTYLPFLDNEPLNFVSAVKARKPKIFVTHLNTKGKERKEHTKGNSSSRMTRLGNAGGKGKEDLA